MLNFARYIFSTKEFFLFHPKKKVDIIVFGRTNLKLDFEKKLSFLNYIIKFTYQLFSNPYFSV